MKCILAVCSDAVSLDKATNLVSLFGIIDGISALTFPHSLSNLAMLFMIKKEAGDRKGATGQVSLSFQLTGSDDEVQKGSTPVKFDFEGMSKLRVLIRSNGITLEGPGTLFGRLWHKDEVLGEWAIDVHQQRELKNPAL